MRYSILSALLAISSPVVFAQFFDSITSPTRDQIIPVGKPFDIIWAPEGVTGTISITLLEGKTNITLEEGAIIGAGINNLDGKYTWKPTENKFDTYGFIIKHEQNTTLTQYSQPFHLSGGSSGPTTGASTTTIHLSTGPSYYASSTSTTSVPSSTVTVISTSTSAPPSTFSTTYPSSNLTISSTIISTHVLPTTTTGSPSSSITAVATGAAVAKVATNGLVMIGGVVLALAF